MKHSASFPAAGFDADAARAYLQAQGFRVRNRRATTA